MKKSVSAAMLLIACLYPVPTMLELYNQNRNEVALRPVFIVIACMAAASALLFLLCRLLFGSPLSALGVCVLGWSFCFSCTKLLHVTEYTLGIKHGNLYLIGAAALLVLLAAGLLLRRVRTDGRFVAICGGALVAVLLAVNGFAFVRGQRIASAYNSIDSYDESRYRSAFTVDASLPSPNVYWFHCDGMLGFDAMEKYFGDPQTAFSDFLAGHSFSVNRTASFQAGGATTVAIPALMCPHFYDSYLAGLPLTNGLHDPALPDDLFRSCELARYENELIDAFAQKGYFTAMVADISEDGQTYPPVTDAYYDVRSGSLYTALEKRTEEQIVSDYFADLATRNSQSAVTAFLNQVALPVGIVYGALVGSGEQTDFRNYTAVPADYALTERDCSDLGVTSDSTFVQTGFAKGFLFAMARSERPRLYIFSSEHAHAPFVYDENGYYTDGGEEKDTVLGYDAQHRYAAAVIENAILRILDADPDAVIILQADHGVHTVSDAALRRALGTDDYEARYSTLSAIRVPEAWQNADLAHAAQNPLNLSRWLVNAFVGADNYSLLP